MNYAELLKLYNKLSTPQQKRKFLQEHPMFAERAQREGVIVGPVITDVPQPIQPGTSFTPATSSTTPPVATQPGPSWGGFGDFPSGSGLPGGAVNPGTPAAPGKDPNDPCPDGWHLEGGMCVLDVTDERDDPCPPGWHLDTASGKCVKDEEKEATGDNDLFAEFANTLAEFGLSGMEDLIKEAVAKGWNEDKFLLEMRKHPSYLANPLFAANLDRAKNGERFMSELEVLDWGSKARALAKGFGYADLSDNYLAEGLRSGLSIGEIEHRFRIQDRVNLMGPGVRAAALYYGFDLGDDDLFDIFDPERDTKEWEDMFRRAQLKGGGMVFGLGMRSDEEVRALEMLGVDVPEALKRMEQLSTNAPTFQRYAAIEDLINQGLPDDFSPDFSTASNSVLSRAFMLRGTPQGVAAMQELEQMYAREVARFKSGGGIVGQGGQAQGLLTPGQRVR